MAIGRHDEKKSGQVLILVPDLSGVGGIENYFRVLSLNTFPQIEYFAISLASKTSKPVKFLYLLTRYFSFVAKLCSPNVQLVQVNPSFLPECIYRDALFCLIAFIFRKQVLVFFRGWDVEFESAVRNSMIRRWLIRFTFGRSRQYLVLGRAFEDRLRSIGLSGKYWIETTVAGDPVPEKNLFANAKYDENPGCPFRILFISRLLRGKGIYTAIEASEELVRRHPDRQIELVVAGEGPESDFAIAYAREKNLNFVRFLGNVTGPIKHSTFLHSNVLLLPTAYREGLPNAILEAMLYGLPIVTRSVGAIGEIVKCGQNGFTTTSTDPSVFADYLETLLKDAELLTRISLLNRSMAERLFTRIQVRDRLMQIYGECLASQI